MSPAYVIGIDLGSQSVKTSIFDIDGVLIADATQSMGAHYPRPGWVEQDPEAFFQATLKTLYQTVTESNITPQAIKCIALDSQIGSPVRIDENWNAIGPVECEIDVRCHPQRNAIMEAYGALILQLNGIYPYVAPKLLWWQQNYPDEYRRTSKVLTLAGYITGRLAGLRAKEAYTDHTFIGIYGLADVEKVVWSEELVQRCGLDLDKLPRITRPWEIVGAITPEVANATRLMTGTPVAAGLGDAIAGWLGVGAVEPGILVDTSGTSHHLATCVETYHPDLKNQVVTHYPSAIPGMWYSLGYTAGTGRTHRWFIDEFCLSEQERSLPDKSQFYQALEEGAARIQPGSEGLIFVPHLGGRVCPYEPDVRGTWIGFTWKHTRHHFYRALLESIAYEFFCYLSVVRQLYPDAPLKQVLSIGGGAKSKLWTQIKADVLGIPLTTPVSRQDFASLGSAIVAGHAVGLFADMAQTAKRFTAIGPSIAPIEANHAIYQRFAAFYQRLFQDLEPTYARLVNLFESP